MTEKIKIISSGKLDAEGWKKIGKSFLISLGGAAIAFIADLANIVDLGGYQNLLLTFLPFAVNFLKLWLGKYESKK